MLDRKVPWGKIPPAHRHLYEAAEKVEWDEWLARGSVQVCTLADSRLIEKQYDKSRIIGLRFVYRDKNASIRTPQSPLPLRAKARLCAQAFNEPLARAGVIKVDSPTVQRIGINIFLQLVVNFRWQKWWRKGDIKSAFLQGKERDVSALGKLY